MNVRSPEIFEIQAEFCKMLAHPKRLMIINLLSAGEKNVGEIAEEIGLSPTNVSQHLRLLKDRHVVNLRKEHQTVFYSLRYPQLIDACHIIQNVLLETLIASGQIAEQSKIPD